jgi:Ca2+/Na+ antiporter
MLLLTLFVSTITYTSGRTNVLQGAVHIMLLLAFLMFIIWHYKTRGSNPRNPAFCDRFRSFQDRRFNKKAFHANAPSILAVLAATSAVAQPRRSSRSSTSSRWRRAPPPMCRPIR